MSSWTSLIRVIRKAEIPFELPIVCIQYYIGLANQLCLRKCIFWGGWVGEVISSMERLLQVSVSQKELRKWIFHIAMEV